MLASTSQRRGSSSSLSLSSLQTMLRLNRFSNKRLKLDKEMRRRTTTPPSLQLPLSTSSKTSSSSWSWTLRRYCDHPSCESPDPATTRAKRRKRIPRVFPLIRDCDPRPKKRLRSEDEDEEEEYAHPLDLCSSKLSHRRHRRPAAVS